MRNNELVDFLTECGLCNICQLRYLRGCSDEHKDVQIGLEHLNVRNDSNEDNDKCDDHAAKKSRIVPCPTCLGLFSKQFHMQLVDGVLNSDVEKYDCGKVVIALCVPIVLQIQQLSMWYALTERFGTIIDRERTPDLTIKETIKLILNPIICNKLQKHYDTDGVVINLTLTHTKESEELLKLQQLHEHAFPRRSNTKRQLISRGIIEKQYTPKHINVDVFKQYFSVPPAEIKGSLHLESIGLTGPTVYIAGRYCKITRQLSHTPWILNDQRVMEDSIEEIISRVIVPYFCNEENKAIFMSSGREDVDVRCLGKGRPFVLEIPNALKTALPCHTAYNLECDIQKSRKISVNNIQMVKREELVNIKSGEEQKRKFYRALCTLAEPATMEILQKLNLPEGFQIQQKTPIRVLHRRPLHTRPRMIYSLKAQVQKENQQVLILDIVSQAGTYIKELVHGEFGRTKPSIASIIGQPIDILALDVMAIDLDWPKDIDNSIF